MINRVINRLKHLTGKGLGISIHYFQIPIIILLITLAACEQQKETAERHDHAEVTTYTCPMHPQVVENEPGTCPICGMDLVAIKGGKGDSPVLMLSESQVLLANIKTKEAGMGTMGNATILSGRIVENEALREVIASRVPGRIEQLYVKETGRKINRGQALYDIYSEELLTYQQEYLLALDQVEQLGEEEPRYANFLESARRRLVLYGMNDSQIKQLTSQRKSDPRITFLSPASGVITSISAIEGSYVQEGARLYTITRLDNLWVEAEVYQSDLDKISEGMSVPVRVAGFSNPVKGTVIFLSPEFRSSSQIVSLRVEIPNPEGEFMPGMQANVLLPIVRGEETSEVVTVPVEAVIRNQEGVHVWIKTGENTFEPRKVVTGDATAEQLVIREGLLPGDTVVTSGAYLLYSEFVLKKGGDPLTALASSDRNTTAADQKIADTAEKSEREAVLENEPFAVAFAHYMQLKEALVASDAQKAQEEAAALQLALRDIPEGKEAAQYADRISGTAQLEEQRQFFFFLNNNFIKMAEQQPILSGELYVQYCPMANNNQGAYWISLEEEIRNPYLPENMLTCGEVKSIIK